MITTDQFDLQELDDIIRAPKACPHRAFDKVLDVLTTPPVKPDRERILDGVDEFHAVMDKHDGTFSEEIKTTQGTIVRVLNEGPCVCIVQFKEQDILHELYVAIEELRAFVDGKYEIFGAEWLMGLIEARNIKTGEWIEGKQPHLSEFTVKEIVRMTNEPIYIARLSNNDGWLVKIVLTAKQAGILLCGHGMVNWGDMFRQTFKMVKPNGSKVINRVALDVWNTSRPKSG